MHNITRFHWVNMFRFYTTSRSWYSHNVGISYISLFANRPTGSSLSNRPVLQHCYAACTETLDNCNGESRHARRPGEHLDAKVLVRGYRCITMWDARVALHGCLTARLMHPSGWLSLASLLQAHQ